MKERTVQALPSTDSSTRPPCPVPLAPIRGNIPDRLTARAQWCLWRYEWSGKKYTKVPYQPNGRKASSTNRATWSDFETVWTAHERGAWDGVGYFLSADDGLAGIDLDRCVEDGRLNPQARHWVAHFASYTELSPSGTGIRIFIEGALDGLTGRKTGNTECYDRDRFLSVTGQRLDGGGHHD
jgi:putative DNA primase/helicase